jgi:hypothetical protein
MLVSQNDCESDLMTTPPPPERRNTFRVNNDVIFDFRVVDNHTAEEQEPEQAIGDGMALYLVAELRRVDREAQQLLKIITEKQRLLGDYLQKLNQKVDLIARHTLFTSGENRSTTCINLSEDGMAFHSDRALYKGNFLVLRMIFLPSYTPVIVFASVSRCEDQGDGGYRIGAKFHRLREQDRQELARQIIRAQVSDRKRSSTSENNQ